MSLEQMRAVMRQLHSFLWWWFVVGFGLLLLIGVIVTPVFLWKLGRLPGEWYLMWAIGMAGFGLMAWFISVMRKQWL